MEEYSGLGNLSENIMIRELHRRLGRDSVQEEYELGNVPGKGLIKESDLVGGFCPKTKPACIFCGSKESLFEYKGKHYCVDCYRELQKFKDER